LAADAGRADLSLTVSPSGFQRYESRLSKSVAQPLDPRRLAFDQKRIETALRKCALARDIVPRRFDETLTLRRRNAGCCAAECGRATPANFYEYGSATLSRDEIDFASRHR
jgi:hypothetical protein